MNPDFDHCPCTIAAHNGRPTEDQARAIHDLMLSINERPVAAIEEILREVQECTLFAGRAGILDETDFGSLFAQHRFHEQVGAKELAEQLELLRTSSASRKGDTVTAG